MVRKKAIDAKESTTREFEHWKRGWKAAAMGFEQGMLAEARTAAFRSLMEAESLEDRDFAVPVCNIGIAVISMEQGKLDESKVYFDKGMASLASQGDPASQEFYAAALRLLAIWHERKGDLSEAEKCLHESVRILSSLGAESSAELANSLSDLALILVREHKVVEAEPLIIKAMAAMAQTVGKDDPRYDCAKLVYEVCLNHQDLEMLAETLEVSLKRLQYKVGARSPNLLRALNAYSSALKEHGMLDRLDSLKENFSPLAFTQKKQP